MLSLLSDTPRHINLAEQASAWLGCVGRCTCVHVRARSVATGGCGLASAISAVRFNLLGAPKRIHRDNAAEYSSEQCSRYTKTQNHTHDDTHIHTSSSGSRALPPSRRRVHAQTYFSSTACYPSSFCTCRRSCSHLHLHFSHFITPTGQAPCQSLLHHTLLALTMLHQQVSKCTVSRAQSESCCRVSSALNLCYLQTQHKLTKPRHFF